MFVTLTPCKNANYHDDGDGVHVHRSLRNLHDRRNLHNHRILHSLENERWETNYNLNSLTFKEKNSYRHNIDCGALQLLDQNHLRIPTAC